MQGSGSLIPDYEFVNAMLYEIVDGYGMQFAVAV